MSVLVPANPRPTLSWTMRSVRWALGIGAVLILAGCRSSITKGLTPTIPPTSAPSRASAAMPDCPGILVPDGTRVAGPIRPPPFTSAVLCQYEGDPSRLSTSHQVQGATAERLRNALKEAPAWLAEASCAPPEPSNPVVLALFVRDNRQVGDAVIYLSGCHVIESPHGTANSDTSFQRTLASILQTGTE